MSSQVNSKQSVLGWPYIKPLAMFYVVISVQLGERSTLYFYAYWWSIDIPYVV